MNQIDDAHIRSLLCENLEIKISRDVDWQNKPVLSVSLHYGKGSKRGYTLIARDTINIQYLLTGDYEPNNALE